MGIIHASRSQSLSDEFEDSYRKCTNCSASTFCAGNWNDIADYRCCLRCGLRTCNACADSQVQGDALCRSCLDDDAIHDATTLSPRLQQILRDHRSNGRKLLFSGYTRHLHTTRHVSSNVLQLIAQWLPFRDGFDASEAHAIRSTHVRISRSLQCFEFLSNDETVTIHGQQSVTSPVVKAWRLKIDAIEDGSKPHLALGIETSVHRLKIGMTHIGVDTADKDCCIDLRAGDVIEMKLCVYARVFTFNNLRTVQEHFVRLYRHNETYPAPQTPPGDVVRSLTFRVYRNASIVWQNNDSHPHLVFAGPRTAYRLSLAVFGKMKLSLLDSWW